MEETLFNQLSQIASLVPVDMGEFSRVGRQKWPAFPSGMLGHGQDGTPEPSHHEGYAGAHADGNPDFHPLTVDAPLYSFDYIHAMGQDTLLLELYDTQLGAFDSTPWEKVLESGQSLPDNPLEPRWYDSLKLSPTLCKKGKKLRSPMESLAADWTQVYVEELKKAPACHKESKRQKVQEYVNGLITKGGPSVNQFKKLVGDDVTQRLFAHYLFPAQD